MTYCSPIILYLINKLSRAGEGRGQAGAGDGKAEGAAPLISLCRREPLPSLEMLLWNFRVIQFLLSQMLLGLWLSDRWAGIEDGGACVRRVPAVRAEGQSGEMARELREALDRNNS